MSVTTVSELRLVVTATDFDAALHLYRDVLGMPQHDGVTSPGGRVAILDAGRATLEIADPAHAASIDALEVGREGVAGHLRVALRVDDVDGATAEVTAAGAELIAPPTPTPWGSRNARFEAAANLQLTLFGP
jgi:lactoylglutathione lyase